MKAIYIILAALLIVSPAYATGNHNSKCKPHKVTNCKKHKQPKPVVINKNTTNKTINKTTSLKSTSTSNSDAVSSSYSAGGSATASSGGSSAHTGDNTITSHVIERTQFAPINTSSVQIGSVSKPVPQVYIQGQTEDDYFAGKRSNAIQAGVSIPITWGTGVGGALSTESQHLRDRNLHEREVHQAEMARVCMELHKFVISTGSDMSPELINRCRGFEHSNNERTNHMMEGVYPIGRHNQEMNGGQISPHREPYKR